MTSATDASVVPIRLTLDGRTGVTLWATPWEEDGEEWQAFLGAGQHVLLFGTAEEMSEHLRSGEDNDLTDHPRWKDLLRLTPAELEPDEDYVFDLDGAYELALSDPDPYTVSELSDLVDLVQRVAEVCDDGTLLKLVEETPEFAALLSDDASFAGAEGEERWTAVGAVVERSWERLLERFSRLVEWRGEPVLAEDADDDEAESDEDEADVVELDDADDDDGGPARTPLVTPAGTDVVGEVGVVEVEDTDDEDDPTDGGTYSIWEVAGILPLSVTLPSGTGYTLRTYNGEDDEPVFLGADLTVDMFRTQAGLAAYARSGEEHDLSEMVTWADIADADDLPVEPEPEEVYDLRSPSEDAIDLALELADYCDLEGVTGVLTQRRSGDMPFDAWKSAIDELETCIRWHD
ncbi:MAG TPA: hypothetical protein VLM05_12830 [Mycobacteriales bacterium]|nr:hypothetical protein [Mycobacteriales bacterium]